MGGLNFINGMFLLGLAAAAVPIIIHLVQRRRVQRVVFGSVRFLRKMSNRVVRRRRFTELILILMRVAALALLALAFSRPFLWDDTDRAGRKITLGEEAVMVLVDHSYSMSARGRLAQAKKLAREVIDELDPHVKVGVAAFAADCRILSKPGASPREAREAVDGIEQSWAGTSLQKALERAQTELQAGGSPKLKIVVISDFQKSSWGLSAEEKATPAAGSTTAPAAPDILDRISASRPAETDDVGWKLKPGIALVIKDVAAPAGEESAPPSPGAQAADEFPNVYVKRVKAPELALAGGLPLAVSAEIVNRTDRQLSNVPVVLRVAGKPVGKDSVNIRPFSQTRVRFRHTFRTPGDVAGSVTIDLGGRKVGDTLAADNVGYFCLPVKPRVHVLLVNGDPDADLSRNDGLYLKTALAPGDAPSPFEVREIAPDAFKPADLTGVSAVLLTNVESVPAPAATALKRFLISGGGVAFFVAGKVTPARFNRTFAGIAPCKLGRLGRSDGDDPVSINPAVDYRHEIFQVFYGPRRGDFSLAPFGQYFTLTESQAARKLARFNNGHPALLEERIGQGRSVLFASSADMEWSEFCIKSIFPPFIQELTRVLCGELAGGGERNRLAGESVEHPVPADVKQVTLRGPDGKATTLQAAGGDQTSPRRSVTFLATAPGVYELTYAGGKARYAANIAPGEPDPVRLDTAVLASRLVSDPLAGRRQVGVGAIMPAETARQRAEASQRYWMWLLALVLAALVVEMVVAARAGAS